MKTDFRLDIPTPCHQNWEAMTPQAEGRFCAACQRCVVDLTAKTRPEIYQLYQENQGELCGRVQASQLDRLARKPDPRKLLARAYHAGWTNLQRFAVALLIAFGFFQSADAQGGGGRREQTEFYGIMVVQELQGTVRGTVYLDEHTIAPYASVRVQTGSGEQFTTVADAKGNFHFAGTWEGNCTFVAGSGHLFSRPYVQHTSEFSATDGIRLYLDSLSADASAELQALERGEIPVQVAATIETAETAAPNEALLRESSDPVGETDADFQFQISPNPTRDEISLTTAQAFDHPVEVSILDLQGQRLLQQRWLPADGVVLRLSTHSLAAGTYLLHLQQPGEVVLVRRFIVE
jgi:hypothetical protein